MLIGAGLGLGLEAWLEAGLGLGVSGALGACAAEGLVCGGFACGYLLVFLLPWSRDFMYT